MRIIGGVLRGLNLYSWKSTQNKQVRPMMDSVKETLFNVLQASISKQTRFLDLFAGTGSLSMEAISRGAFKAYAVEAHPQSINIIQKNKSLLKTKSYKLRIHKRDVFAFIKDYCEEPFDVIVACPPFPLELGEKIMQNLVPSGLYKIDTVAVIETGYEEELKQDYPPFYLFQQKDFGDKKLWFYQVHKQPPLKESDSSELTESSDMPKSESSETTESSDMPKSESSETTESSDMPKSEPTESSDMPKSE